MLWSDEVSWYDWDPENGELSPGLGELNLSRNGGERTRHDLEPVKIGFSVKRFLTKLFTGPLGGKEWDERYRYLVKKMEIQPEILDLLRDLPVSAGLAIRRDLQGVEEFYSLISGKDVVLERDFVDLTSLVALAGYKLQARNMTAMGAQVMGSLLNKTESTDDNCWGLRGKKIPKCLQCYALRNIKFGFITYSVLAGLLLRDVFLDPDVICRFLKCDQITAMNWFLEFVLLSLEAAEEQAWSREDVIRSLRLQDSRDKLCEAPPSFVKLWLEILGSWPTLTSWGCRFLLPCREWFLVQIWVLARAKIQWSDDGVLRFPRDEDLEYSRFGLSLEEIGNQAWREPVFGTWSMVHPAGVKIPFLEFDVSSTKPCEIGRRCYELGWCHDDELIEGTGGLDYYDLDFKFEIPKEVEEIEV
jgi:hypothetical protein